MTADWAMSDTLSWKLIYSDRSSEYGSGLDDDSIGTVAGDLNLPFGEDPALRNEKLGLLLGGTPPDDPAECRAAAVESVFQEALRRWFGVIFWFVVLGPLAAWAYRATDLIRRRAVFNATRGDGADANADRMREAAETLHGWVAWIPARLTAIGYAAAGHMDDAIAAFRAPMEEKNLTTSERSEHLLARVGLAALALQDRPDESPAERAIRGAQAASHLVFKLLLIWAVIISAMTLYGFTQ